MQSDQPVLRCADLTEDLAAGDDTVFSTAARDHVSACLRCQAELANFRRLRRSMRALADSPVPVDPSLEHEILLAIDDAEGRSTLRTTGYAAAAVGGLAAAAGVIALATRGRRGARLAV